MNRDDIDKLLANEETITPSPGFLASVMQAVEREAAMPAPLAFPWKRAWPGFAALGVALSAAIWHLLGSLGDSAVTGMLGEQVEEIVAAAAGPVFPSLVLTVSMTAVSLLVSGSLVRTGKHA